MSTKEQSHCTGSPLAFCPMQTARSANWGFVWKRESRLALPLLLSATLLLLSACGGGGGGGGDTASSNSAVWDQSNWDQHNWQ